MQYGLIGYPLSHSFSKKYFTDKFQREGIAGHTYALFPLETIEQLPHLLTTKSQLKGLNVTIPYKEQVLPYLDAIDEAAAQVGAVNTIKIKAGKLTGYNTDVYGFEQSLRPFLGVDQEQHALILGTGGAAKAVAYVLKKLDISFQYVSRKKKDGYLIYEELDAVIMAKTSIIINTTPLGMHPNSEKAPNIPYPLLKEGHLLYDLIYNPEKTVFLNNGLRQACRIKNGLEMLHLQAEKAWQIWNL